MLTVSVAPIDKDILVVVNDNLSPAAQSRALAAFAREQAVATDDVNKEALGYLPSRTTTVDGVAGASEDRVRPNGTIVYEYALVLDLFAFIEQALLEHSPVKSGRYERSHALFADGQPVDPNGDVPQASEYVFANTQPYARKIETGESPIFPDGIYEATAALAKARYDNVAHISFEYRSVTGSDLSDWAISPKAVRHASHHRRVSDSSEWLQRQPAIVITVQ